MNKKQNDEYCKALSRAHFLGYKQAKLNDRRLLRNRIKYLRKHAEHDRELEVTIETLQYAIRMISG